MAFDPFLYVAFLIGFGVGRLTAWRSPWIERATLASVIVLLLLLGATLHSVPAGELVGAFPVALAFLAAIVGATLGIAAVLGRPAEPDVSTAPRPSSRPWLVGVFAGSLVIGYVVLGPTGASGGGAIEYALYVLLALVAFDLRVRRAHLSGAWRPVASAAGGAVIAAVVVTVLVGFPARVAFATSLGFGWYTLAGPLVGSAVGPALGLVAFLVNFLRESVTMVSAPWVGRRFGGEGIAATGGATSMDTTLYFVSRFGGPRGGGLGIATGLLLTVAAGVLLPLILGVP